MYANKVLLSVVELTSWLGSGVLFGGAEQFRFNIIFKQRWMVSKTLEDYPGNTPPNYHRAE